MRTDLPRRYLLFPFLSVIATSLTLAGLRAAGLPTERAALALGIRDPALLRVRLYALWAAAAAWALARILRREGIGLADLGWRGRLSPDAIGLAALGAWAAAMIWLPFDALRQALGIPLYWNPAQRGFIQPASIPEFAAAALAGLILVPPAEETMFRGYVLPALEGRIGRLGALLLHNVLFALYHGAIGPGLVLYIFFWSFFPALLYLRYRSIYPPMLMHFLNNIWADLLVPILFSGR
ncbi:CPBP family intramembrane glutamic endopeptidase [Thermoflexus hugenholtzii]